ncbi:MAG TPA: hypothetical protein VK804_12605 [Bradyrhizobium sp.]|jgi:hypothetical protein|uniref:hypothetical protein n=1 Tax=Bradyrhizobium sp. TaxID=376 RepID=UPI002B5F1E7C|nr:hypothetical protein [Bradyrhizobium sp.]HTB01311.1 hypothetical protein [Bradyrhizobium sp.]
MPKTTDGRIALVALIALAAWLLIGLPLIYLPFPEHVHGEILGVKYGEWLLFAATMGLWWATWRLVRSAENTAERQLRAYIFPQDVTITNIESIPEITVVLKNTGQTPAHDHTLWATMAVAAYPLSTEPAPPDGDPNESKGPLAPGAVNHFFASLESPITQEELRGIREGRAAIYLAGAVLYTDAFGKSRSTKFCYFRGHAGLREFADGPMSVYKKWNEAN